ncbi:uroporphyrinogen-III C-methyltransferase [Rhodopila sp.]|jgi:uroporphyrin-III C-methyltransferase|uniref:uroporphyrinogen-III C-methyltransferase n=1 Tax=Rhodopila sp. TaxID=2480087 RepID=UPI002C39A878|nr:uroporphyrinogen-III C-methyltransferase [Rhodopila sp.]HVZ06333.1 uroporphyrinogen-III C-methyltransferase [Rhodopila sp.]
MHLPHLNPPAFVPGSVWLVGAGPGDPGLLTLHAAYALSQADVVVHDALVPAEILALAGPARLELAGKRAGGIRTQQMYINARLIRLARQGQRVVRLKGGDPLIFGRGGEEALALATAGIPFRIVPGISAGIGGTAAAGIPLTHRGLARSVAFATGHDSSGDLADVDWTALSRGSEVLVFYMAQRRIAAIARRLIDAGRDPDDAIALISNATRPDQEVRITTLAVVAETGAEVPADAATLVVSGPVLALRPLLAGWQQTEPMKVTDKTMPRRAVG